MSQKTRVRDILLKHKAISRNWAIDNRLTIRLGAIIHELIKEGMIIEGRNVKTERGKDFIYYLEEQNTLL